MTVTTIFLVGYGIAIACVVLIAVIVVFYKGIPS